MSKRFLNMVADRQDLGGETAEPVVAAEMPEQDMLQAVEPDQTSDGLSEGMGDAVDVADQITEETIPQLQEVAEKDGGMTETVAATVESLLKFNLGQLGFRKHEMSRIPSRESFGGNRDRRKATNEAIDALKDKAVEIWNWIVKAFEDIVAWVKKFFSELFNAATKLKNRAAALKKAAEEHKKNGKSYKTDKVKTGAFYSALRMEGKINKTAIIAQLAELAGKSPTETAENTAKKFGDAVKAVIDAAKTNSSEFEKKVVTLAGELKTMWASGGMSASSNTQHAAPDDAKLYESENLLGDMAVYAIVPETTEYEKLSKVIGKMKLFLDKSSRYSESGTQDEVEPLGVEDVIKISADVEKAMAVFEKYKGTLKAVEAIATGLATSCKELFKKAEGDSGGEQRKQASTASKVAVSYINFVNAGLKKNYAWAIKATKGALDYCQASMKTA